MSVFNDGNLSVTDKNGQERTGTDKKVQIGMDKTKPLTMEELHEVFEEIRY